MVAMIKMVVVLSMLCALSGFALSYLKMSTANRIEEQVLTYVQSPAILSVFPYAENDPLAERQKFPLPNEEGKEIMVFPFKKDGKLVGVALENYGTGYGGAIGVMVGFNVENNTLIGIGITTMSETPGLGTKVKDESFTKKFISVPSEAVNLTGNGGTIDAIGGATISSAATVVAVQEATKDFLALKDTLITTWNK